MVFFREIHVFLQLSWIALLKQNEPFKIFKILIGRKYSFQKVCGKNSLDAPAFNTGGFLSRDTCVTSGSWIGLFGKK
jgi:hypothetical protein